MTGRDEDNMVRGHFEATGIRPKFMSELADRGISLPAELFRPDAVIQ
jgi:pilus assembly protein CpaF